MVVLITCKYEEEPIKNEGARVQDFLHCNSMGAICCHGNQSSNLIWPKTSCSPSPTPMMPQITFGCNRPAGCGDIHVRKCARTDTHMHGRQLDSYPISSHLVSLWLRRAKNRFITIFNSEVCPTPLDPVNVLYYIYLYGLFTQYNLVVSWVQGGGTYFKIENGDGLISKLFTGNKFAFIHVSMMSMRN